MSCTDCPHGCAARGPRSWCGVDRPGRLHWHGVTLLEEHELAPTYELYFTGCSLRCRFCTVPEAIEAPDRGAWLSPRALVEAMAGPEVPAFRSIAMVGGDPTVNRPYLDALLPLLRARFPAALLVLNTNLFLPAALARLDAAAYDWIVGDVHFWQPDCAAAVARVRGYPPVAVQAAEAIVQAGGRLMLRVLVLPGHLDCCAAPTIDWAADLARQAPDRVRVHVMTHYAPAGRARVDPALGRSLTDAERARARALLPVDVPRPRSGPLMPLPVRAAAARDPEVPVEIGPDGRLLLPFVTGELLELAIALDPELAARRIYLSEAT